MYLNYLNQNLNLLEEFFSSISQQICQLQKLVHAGFSGTIWLVAHTLLKFG